MSVFVFSGSIHIGPQIESWFLSTDLKLCVLYSLRVSAIPSSDKGHHSFVDLSLLLQKENIQIQFGFEIRQ